MTRVPEEAAAVNQASDKPDRGDDDFAIKLPPFVFFHVIPLRGCLLFSGKKRARERDGKQRLTKDMKPLNPFHQIERKKRKALERELSFATTTKKTKIKTLY